MNSYLQCIFDMGLIFLLLRMLDIKYTGGDVKEAFPCHQKQGTVDHTNTDIIENEDEDVKAERERVKDIFARNNIKVIKTSNKGLLFINNLWYEHVFMKLFGIKIILITCYFIFLETSFNS